ncbi:hypothetical protein E2C01_030308 [Portunus trituberculatus]|uniref:Secreted protein n=1 Tax=Portunus trituberculatus TaxID=210409 RepID=A0A5B7ERR0_PORTR|nr:hypothetical protein [Portunus trituberculatus]
MVLAAEMQVAVVTVVWLWCVMDWCSRSRQTLGGGARETQGQPTLPTRPQGHSGGVCLFLGRGRGGLAASGEQRAAGLSGLLLDA